MRVSLYGKRTNAGDTPFATDASGDMFANVNAWAGANLGAPTTPGDGTSISRTSPMVLASPYLYNGSTLDLRRSANAAAGTTGTGLMGSGLMAFDGTNWQRLQTAQNASLLASAARTAQTTSADQTNQNARGVQVVLNVTVASGTGGLQVKVQAKDSVSGQYYDLNADPTAVTTTGTYIYEVYPGVGAASGSVTQRTSSGLPQTWRVLVKVGDNSSYTYSIGASTIL
jgi:hypothetical protein